MSLPRRAGVRKGTGSAAWPRRQPRAPQTSRCILGGPTGYSAWDVEVRIRRTFSEDKPRVEIVLLMSF